MGRGADRDQNDDRWLLTFLPRRPLSTGFRLSAPISHVFECLRIN